MINRRFLNACATYLTAMRDGGFVASYLHSVFIGTGKALDGGAVRAEYEGKSALIVDIEYSRITGIQHPEGDVRSVIAYNEWCALDAGVRDRYFAVGHNGDIWINGIVPRDELGDGVCTREQVGDVIRAREWYTVKSYRVVNHADGVTAHHLAIYGV